MIKLRIKIFLLVWLLALPILSVFASTPSHSTPPYKTNAAPYQLQPAAFLGLTKSKKKVGFGELAQEAMGPLSALTHFIQAICTIAGVGLFFGSFLQFNAHRRNPSEIRLGQPIAMLIAGLALLLLGFLSYL